MDANRLARAGRNSSRFSNELAWSQLSNKLELTTKNVHADMTEMTIKQIRTMQGHKNWKGHLCKGACTQKYYMHLYG